MGQVVPQGQLLATNLRSAYPFQLQPTIQLPDLSLNAVMGNAVSLQDIVCDPGVGGVYSQPVFVPHNQKLTGGTVRDRDRYADADLPEWKWDSTGSTWTTVSGQNFRAKHFGNQTCDFTWNSAASPAGATLTLTRDLHVPVDGVDERIQGFLALISRSVYNKIPKTSSASYEVQWYINTSLYSVIVESAKFAKFRVSTNDGASWKDVASNLKVGGSQIGVMGNSAPGNGQNQVPLEVLLLNGVLQIRFGGQAAPYHYRVGGGDRDIKKVIVKATCFTQFNIEIHPLKFASASILISNPLALGFPPDPSTPPYYFVAGISGFQKLNSGSTWNVSFPTGSKITITRSGGVSDAEQQYTLAMQNEIEGAYHGVNYSRRTAVVTRVTIAVDGIYASAPVGAVPLIPKTIQSSIRFNPNALTIRSSVSFTADNFHGQWRGQAGNIAVQLALGYSSPSTSLFPQFTGMCGKYIYARPGANRATIQFECCDLMKMLEDAIIWAPPVMDGWNHYYAIAFIAQLAGISLGQMAFASLVPTNPYTAAGGDPEPYFLPTGEGMRPWTPRDRESSALELADYVRKPTGFLLFFDAQGFLRYEKWLPPSLAAQKRAFTEYATGFDGLNLTEYFNMTLVSDIEQVRNQIILLGIDPWDPRWSLILEKREDTASIYAGPGSEPLNYIGYKRPFVWTDSRFANQAFAATAADRLYEILRIPGLEVTFECWMQPDIYPMDVIYIAEHKSGTDGVPFYVLGTDTSWAYEGGGQQVFRTQIHGKFLTD